MYGVRGVSAYDLNQEDDINSSLFHSKEATNSDPKHVPSGEVKEIKVTSFYEEEPKTTIVKYRKADGGSTRRDSCTEFTNHRNSCELIKEKITDLKSEKNSSSDLIDDQLENIVITTDFRRTSFSLRPTTIPDGIFEHKYDFKSSSAAKTSTPASILRVKSKGNKELSSSSSSSSNMSRSLPSTLSIAYAKDNTKTKTHGAREKLTQNLYKTPNHLPNRSTNKATTGQKQAISDYKQTTTQPKYIPRPDY